MKIKKDLLKDFLNNELIICLGSKKEALNYCNIYNYDNFKTIKEMFLYYGKYMFIYQNKVYSICDDIALNVYK